MKELLDYMNFYVPLAQEAQQAVMKSFKLRTYNKNEVILREGDICQQLFFMLSGTTRTYYTHKGKEITTWIYPDGAFVTAWSSFLSGKSSFEAIHAIEQTQVAFITKTTLYQLYNQHQSIERFGRYLAEEQLTHIETYSKGYLFLSAKEKYENLLSVFPDVELRANLGDIASMLGISRETLSRLRKERG